jgi:hypothetical protein
MTSAELRPLGFGEMLDRAVTLAVRNAGPLVAAVALPYVPLALLQWALLGDFYAGEPVQAITASDWGWLALTTLLGMLVFAFARAAAVAIAYGAYLERRVGVGSAFHVALARFRAMVALGVVTVVCFVALTALLLLPMVIVGGIVTAAGMTDRPAIVTAFLVTAVIASPFLLWFALGFDMASIGVTRGSGGFAALRTALGATVFRNPSRSLIAGLIVSLLSFAAVVILSFASDSLPSAGWRVFASLGIGTVASIASEIVTVTFLVVYDVDVAVRHEGFDLALALAETVPEPPSG